MNKNVLHSILVKSGETQKDLALLLGLSLSRTNAKINAKNAQFTQNEMNLIKKHYKLTSDEVVEIFFT